MCNLIHDTMNRWFPCLFFFGCVGSGPPLHVAKKGCRDSVQFNRPIARGLGLSSHLEWGDTPEDVAYREYELSRWADLGTQVVRRDMTWTVVEPQPGHFDFGPAEIVVDAVGSVGADFVALLSYGHPGYPPYSSEQRRPPEDPADYARYAAAFADHFADELRYYEIWNEPNAGIQFWQPKEDPEAFGALVAATSPAIRAADADAEVVLGGLFWPDLFLNTTGPDFLDQVGAALPDLADLVDVISIHPYRYPFTAPDLPSDSQGSMVSEICAAWDQMEDLGLGEHEMWIGELGWHTAPDAFFPGADEATHAAWLVRAAVLSFAQGASQFAWYTFRDSGDNVIDQEDMFGLVGFDPDPTDDVPPEEKQAFGAYVTLMHMLGTHDTITDGSVTLGLGPEHFGYLLSGGEGETWVLWSTGESTELDVPVSEGARVHHVQMGGDSRVVRPVYGTVRVAVGTEPVYLSVVVVEED